MTSEYKNIEYRHVDGVAVIALNRPAVLNCLDVATLADIMAALTRVKSEAARVVIFTGNGRGFCVGADLSSSAKEQLADPDPHAFDLGAGLEQHYNPVAAAIMALEVPLITAVNGIAAGAGLSIALMGDVVLAGRSAAFKPAFPDIGLIPDMGGTWLLPRLAGWSRAMALIALGDAITAERAAEWGLVLEVVDDAQLQVRALELATRMARLPSKALSATKRAFRLAMSNDFSTQLALEVDMQRVQGYTHDFREGVAAFLEKRPAKFKHC